MGRRRGADHSPPQIGTVGVGDVDFVHESFSDDAYGISVWWLGFADDDSGISQYVVSIEEEDERILFPELYVGHWETRFRLHVQLSQGVHFKAKVTAVNGAGLSSSLLSEIVTMDLTRPVVESVFDMGENALEDVQVVNQSTVEAFVGFVAFDSESGVVHASWSASAGSPGLADLLDWQSVDAGPARLNVLDLNGWHIVLTVEVTNGAGSRTRKSSDGFVVDLQPPWCASPPCVHPAPGAKSFTCRWHGIQDEETRVTSYHVQVQCANLGILHELCTWRDAKTASSFSWNNVEPEPGSSCYCNLRAWDAAGHTQTFQSTSVMIYHGSHGGLLSTDAWIVDLRDGLRGTYSFENSEGCVARNEIAVFEGADMGPVVPFHVSNFDWAILSGPWLREGGQFQLLMRSISCLGEVQVSFSSRTSVDTIPPAVVDTSMCQKSLFSTCYFSRLTALRAPISCTDSGSGPNEARVYLREALQSLSRTIVQLESTTNISFEVDTSQLATGAKYKLEIECVDTAQNSYMGRPHQFVVDDSPPQVLLGNVIDGQGREDSDIFRLSDTFSGSWEGAFRDMESPISHYSVGLASRPCGGTTEADPDVIGFFQWEDIRGSFSLPFNLTENFDYYIFVRATNFASLSSSVACSNGFRVSNAVPECDVVVDGRDDQDVDWSSYDDSVSVFWRCSSSQVGLQAVHWTAFVVESGQWRPLLFRQISAEDGPGVAVARVSLAHMDRIASEIEVFNVLGISKTFRTNGFTVDRTRPSLHTIVVGNTSTEGRQYISDASVLSATWSCADPESPSFAEWKLVELPSEQDLTSWVIERSNTLREQPIQLSHSMTFALKIRCINEPGLAVTKTSAPVTIDESAPILDEIPRISCRATATETPMEIDSESLALAYFDCELRWSEKPPRDPESGIATVS
eukprot:2112646-Rhodomonas_salina.1